MIFFTSDQHFGHANILTYCNRPFANVHEMDDALIARWNERVGDKDVVYHLADFTFGNLDSAIHYFSQLKGMIYILSNPWHHDKRWIAALQSSRTCMTTASGNIVYLLPPMVVLEDVTINKDSRGVPAVLCHYPLAEWDRKHYGSIHLHGHSHGNYKPIDDAFFNPGASKDLILDVGVDCHDFYPVSMPEILERMRIC